MKKTKTIIASLIMFLTVVLVACGPSDEKLSEAETARNLLIQAKASAEEVYLDITDSSMKDQLDALAEEEAKIEAMDFTKLSDKKIDEILPTITELTEKYQSMKTTLDGTYQAETSQKEEAAKNVGLGSYIINSTGMNITEIILHDITRDTYSENILGDGVTLEAGYTLMGISLDVYSDSTEWEFQIKDENNTTYTLPCESLSGLADSGASLEFKYDKAEGTGSVVVGGYTTN
ncbi:hypothetical protein [Butyrivibrio proteoclasticus]|uniref:hypothetical protein n=1 Tax=Butyrivibrio proteoclasticus TaxID=43305 RepID=UPI000478B14F|nr:hypothetical protein [Butyrivibrio proteoclasticus]